MDRLDHVANAVITALGTVPVQEIVEIPIIICETAFQKIVQCLFLQDCGLSVIADSKVRLHIYKIEKMVDHIESKGMESTDAGSRHEFQLILQFRHFSGFFLQRPAYLLPHFRSGGVGKGHHEHSVDGHALFSDHLLDALYKYCRLSRTGSGRNEQIPVSLVYSPLLLFSPTHNILSCVQLLNYTKLLVISTLLITGSCVII